MDNKAELIYAQDCDFLRNHMNLMWSRIQSVSVIEGGWLWVYLQSFEYEQNGIPYNVILWFGFILIAFLCVIPLKDRAICETHLQRIKTYENERVLTLPADVKNLKGSDALVACAALIVLANLVLLAYRGGKMSCC